MEESTVEGMVEVTIAEAAKNIIVIKLLFYQTFNINVMSYYNACYTYDKLFD